MPRPEKISPPCKIKETKMSLRLFRHGHKNTVLQVKFNRNGNWLLTASRDQSIRLFDIRTMKDVQTFKGHKREVTGASSSHLLLTLSALAWHPFHEELFVSAGFDGSILFWL